MLRAMYDLQTRVCRSYCQLDAGRQHGCCCALLCTQTVHIQQDASCALQCPVRRCMQGSTIVLLFHAGQLGSREGRGFCLPAELVTLADC
jgi:hypothetical protein